MDVTAWDWVVMGSFGAIMAVGLSQLRMLWRDPSRWAAFFSQRWIRGMPLAIVGGCLGVIGFGVTVLASEAHGLARSLLIFFGTFCDLGFAAALLLWVAVFALGRPRGLGPPALRR
jgi:hypothetical protein